jgi:hypothetical protein
LLDFPGEGVVPGGTFDIEEDPVELLDVPRRARYVSRGVASGPTSEVVTLPRPPPSPSGPSKSGAKQLRVSATMTDPNLYGGIVVRDYRITVKGPVVKA